MPMLSHTFLSSRCQKKPRTGRELYSTPMEPSVNQLVIASHASSLTWGQGVGPPGEVMKGKGEPCIMLVKLNHEGWVKCVKYRMEEVTSGPCDSETNTWKPAWVEVKRHGDLCWWTHGSQGPKTLILPLLFGKIDSRILAFKKNNNGGPNCLDLI